MSDYFEDAKTRACVPVPKKPARSVLNTSYYFPELDGTFLATLEDNYFCLFEKCVCLSRPLFCTKAIHVNPKFAMGMKRSIKELLRQLKYDMIGACVVLPYALPSSVPGHSVRIVSDDK